MTANRAALERARASWTAGDLAGYLELYDEGIRLHGYSPEPMDRASATGFYESVWAAFPQSRLEFHDVIEQGDDIVVRFTLVGRHEGPFLGVPATGREVTIPGITIIRFGEGGRAVERWSQADMLGALVQLGAVPAP